MSKSKIFVDKLAKLMERSMLNSKDISDEIKSVFEFKRDELVNKLNFVTKEEFEVQKERLNKLQKEFNSLKKKLKR
jgi:BMFP domain-containing protein YqiC